VVLRALAALALSLLAACEAGLTGGGGTSPSPTDATAEAAEESAARQLQCQEQTEEFLDELSELNSRLGVGVQFDTYLDLVGDVRVEYDQVDFNGMDFTCLQEVGIPAEAALKRYSEAAKIWNRCITDLGCDFDSVKPKLQAKWAQAANQIADAERNLENLGPGF
jgi:hypothetical protein